MTATPYTIKCDSLLYILHSEFKILGTR